MRLLNGKAEILAAPLAKDQSLIVRRERQFPIEARSEVNLELKLGESGEIMEIAGSSIPSSWAAAVDVLAEMEQGKVVVVGSTDVGKSTLCTFLANSLLSKGRTIRIVDGDIGQADIGPPTTIGSAVSSDYIFSLVDLKAESLLFIGNTSPSQVEPEVIDGLRRLVACEEHTLTIINTDGWIQDPEATLYKVRLISAIDPDLIIGIARHNELDPILSGSKASSLRVEAPEEVLTRSRTDRRELRTAGYRRFLKGAATKTFQLQSVRVKLPRGIPELQQVPRRDLRNTIVGLLDNEGFLLGIGVLLEFEKNSLRIYSKIVQDVSVIELGLVKLSLDGTETGFLTL